MDWDLSYTSKSFNAYIAKAQAKLIHQVSLTELDEVILEAASVIMELHERVENSEEAIAEVHAHMDELEKYLKVLNAKNKA